MKFDTVIIGGGLTGLICGIRLSLKGQRCAIISSGQSALHFSSGSFDLFNALPNGKKIMNPIEALPELITSFPEHPYTKIGKEKFIELSSEAKNILNTSGVSVEGSADKNHYRITPLGTLKPTWLTLSDLPLIESIDSLSYSKVTIFNVAGFLDFYPRFIADELKRTGTESNIVTFSLPELDTLRRNPSELRSTNIARVLDKKESINHLAKILTENSHGSEAIILPAIIGQRDYETFNWLQENVDKPVLLIPTFPPSVGGIRSQQILQNYFSEIGGTYLLGDSAQKSLIENNRVTKVYSYNHGDIPFTANNFVLATGSYFSQGMIATHEKVYEPVFGLDVSFIAERYNWYKPDMFTNQPYQSFGVKTGETFRGIINNREIENLYVAGAILDGFNPVKEGNGGGVSLMSALYVADCILNNGR